MNVYAWAVASMMVGGGIGFMTAIILIGATRHNNISHHKPYEHIAQSTSAAKGHITYRAEGNVLHIQPETPTDDGQS